jgi:hypothetical protein
MPAERFAGWRNGWEVGYREGGPMKEEEANAARKSNSPRGLARRFVLLGFFP